jgi:alkylation response protein AidB-like acyl-CoA dehydrogenase
VDFELTDEMKAFQAKVEAFLDEHATPDVADVCRENMAQIVDTPARRAFMKKLSQRGWLGMT